VIDWIADLLQHPFVCYGYKKVTDWLRQNKALIINKKKVYRLMKQARLLLPKKIADQSARCFVEVRKMSAGGPNEAFQFDIKMYWVTGLGWVPCLSVIDIFTRQLRAYLLQRSIRQHDVKALWQDLLKSIPAGQHRLIRVRSDNGSQFAAKTVRAFFAAEGIHHEFCHVATPEEDGFIESFHAIVERELVRRHEWQSLLALAELMASYVYFYNTERLHGSLGNVSPDQFARQWADAQ
jgi:putative transposase